MDQKKVIALEERIPRLKNERKQRSNRRLIFYLSFFFILLAAVVYFQSPLSYIKMVEVVGNSYISEELIIDRSQIDGETSYWGINYKNIENDIKSLTEIKDVIVTRKFPNTILIEVKEYSRVAYLVINGHYYPILETGEILEAMPSNYFPNDAPFLMDWNTDNELAEMAAELSKLPESIINRISEIYYTPVEADPLRITLFMNDGFKVSSSIRHFSNRIQPYPTIVKELDPNVRGIIHMKMNPYFEQFGIEEEHEIESEG